MAKVNLLIGPIPNYTPTQRAEAISEALWDITRPITVKLPTDLAKYMFAWKTHSTTGECVLIAETTWPIVVHPQKDLTELLALFPTLSEAEKNGLAGYISNSQTFLFGAIIPSNSTILTDAQLEEDGWNETL